MRRLFLILSFAAHAAVVAVASAGTGAHAPIPPRQDLPIDTEVLAAPPTDEAPPPPRSDAFPHVATTATYTPRSHASPPSPARDEPTPATPAPSAALTTSIAPLPHFSLMLGTSAASADATSPAGGVTATGATPSPAASPNANDDEPAVTVPAYLVSSGKADYPEDARAEGREADVDLAIVVAPSGRVIDATVIRGAGHGFDESALRAVRTYRFAPAEHEGAPVRVRMRWTVAFRLE